MARLRRSWRTWRGLSWAERRLLLHAWLLLPLAAASLRLLGYNRARALLLPPAAGPLRTDLPAAQATARVALSAARWSPVSASCLARSLALCRLLRRQGLAADLRIGVARPDSRFAAHAWVEHGGVALAEAADLATRYAAFEAAPLASPASTPEATPLA